MEEAIYRMSFTESCLVLIIIGLWLFAVINLAKKLERICNPPSIQPNYSTAKLFNLNTSIRSDQTSNTGKHEKNESNSNLVRSNSEPAIEQVDRQTTLIRSPSETCLSSARPSFSQHQSSPCTLELGENSLSPPMDHQYHTPKVVHFRAPMEKALSLQRPTGTETFLYPRRLPSIVRRSLLDLHRRALVFRSLSQQSQQSTTPSLNKINEERIVSNKTKIPIGNRTYHRANAIDDERE